MRPSESAAASLRCQGGTAKTEVRHCCTDGGLTQDATFLRSFAYQHYDQLLTSVPNNA